MPGKNKNAVGGTPKSKVKQERDDDAGGKDDDCSDLTDNNHETDESTSKSFPQKLLEILSTDEYSSIISWLPHGNGFIIHKKKAFASDVLPKHFKASKFTSFTRKLNRWGFSRAPRGPETGAYFHKMFQRENPEMVLQMTSNSGNKVQASTIPGGPLLPAGATTVPTMMMPTAPGAMPFYTMPSTQMAMLTPQQQQAFWHQQMQLYQFQQMQMFQFQQQQQAAAAAAGAAGSTPTAVPPMMFPSMMMPMPIPVPVLTTPAPATAVVPPATPVVTTNDEPKEVKQESKDDFPSLDSTDIDTDANKVGI